MDKMSYGKLVVWLVQNNFHKKSELCKNKVMEVWYNSTMPDVVVTLMFNPKKK